MLARTVTHALVGLDARRVEVEAHLQLGVPAFAIVGLADRACQEAKERVRSGIASAELEWPVRRITVNLAPAELRKEGSGFDLPIALAVLANVRGSLRRRAPVVIVINDRRELYPEILELAGLRLEERYRRHVNRRTGRRAGEFFEDVIVAR